jgi:ABC-type Fe3+ transport system substrate-binding protein
MVRFSKLDRRSTMKGLAAAGVGLAVLDRVSTAAATVDVNDTRLGPLIELARREGSVTVSGNLVQKAETKREFTAAFRAYYGLDESFAINWIVKSVGPTQKSVEDEINANKVAIDAVMLNVVGWAESLAKRGKLMAFDAPEYANYAHLRDKPMFLNQPYYVCDPGYLFVIGWNSDVIRDAKFESWFDLLKPEYKGKITSQSARLSPSAAVCFQGMKTDPQIGPDFFKRLAELDLVTIQLSEQASDKVVTGDFPITLGPGPRLYSYWQDGAKQVRMSVPKEGAVLLPNYWIGLAGAPHPNATKLLLNFARSREAAQILMVREGRMTGRLDVVSPNGMFVPTLQDNRWIDVDQSKMTGDDFRKLGAEWRDLFGT